MAASRRPRPKKQLIYEGPAGKCACCDRKTEIKIASPLGQPSVPGWVVPLDVMRDLYHAVTACIREKKANGKTMLYVNDPDLRPTRDPKSKNGWGLRRTKLFFVEGANGQFAGPYGPDGLKVFLRRALDTEGRAQDMRVYVVATTHRALQIIQNSPLAHEVAPAEEGGEPDSVAGVDLF